MQPNSLLTTLTNIVSHLIGKLLDPTFLIVVGGLGLILYLANRLLEVIVPRLARILTRHADKATSNDRMARISRLETFLGIWAAIIRTLMISVAAYIVWKVFNPTTAPLAIVGASALFVVLAGATVGPLLRDLTTGIIMIAEQWYHVGDHISVEPFLGISGIVERITLRSTKLRSLNGEIIWLHNQYIQGVKVTPRGVRTLSIEAFVEDLERGRQVIEQAISTMPTGPTMIARKLKVGETEQLGEGIWRISVTGQTIPGREWLIEDFAVKTITKYDSDAPGDSTIVHGPIVRYVDPMAEKRFRRSIRAKA